MSSHPLTTIIDQRIIQQIKHQHQQISPWNPLTGPYFIPYCQKAPACVRCEIPIFTVLTDRTPMQMRNAPEFKQYFQQIWKELNHDT